MESSHLIGTEKIFHRKILKAITIKMLKIYLKV